MSVALRALTPDAAPADLEAALAAVRAVDAACRAGDDAEVLDEAAQLRLAHDGLAGARLWLALDDGPDGPAADAVGFALLTGTSLDLAVAPAARRRGTGTALAAAVAEVAGPRVLAWSHVDHPGAAALARRHDLHSVRELLVMARPASNLPALPERDDVRVRAYDPASPDDAADLLRINAAAFAHHPEQGAMDADDLARRTAQGWFDPAGLLLAVDAASGATLGFHWTKIDPAVAEGGTTGEVYVVGVAPEAQGRGLGTLVTLAGLHHLAGRGVDEIELYVEGDNHPARAVYSGLGFEVVATHVQYARG